MLYSSKCVIHFQIMFSKLLSQKRIRDKKKIAVVCSSAVATLLAILILIVVFGLDQYFFKSDLSGTIVSSQGGKSLEGAEILIQGQSVQSKEDGTFYFPDLRYGLYEVVISKNGYVNHREKIKVNRLHTNINVVLELQEFGDWTLRLEGYGLEESNLEVLINNQPFKVQKDENGFFVRTGRLLVGDYKLNFTSDHFLDTENGLEVVAGEHEKIIPLYPAGDIVTEFEDYLSGQTVSPDEVIVQSGDDIKKDKYLVENKLEAKDLDIDKEIKIVVRKAGYIEKIITTKLMQGLNSLDTTYLAPNWKVLALENNKIFSVYSDGSDGEVLYEGSGKCNLVLSKNNSELVRCGDKLLLFTKESNDYRLEREYINNSNNIDLLSNSKKLITIGPSKINLVEFHSADNYFEIYNHGKEIVSILSDSSDVIYFSDTDAVYRLDRVENKAIEVTKGRYYLSDYSAKREALLATSNQQSESNNLWEISLKSKQSRKISFLPGNYMFPRYYGDNGIMLIKDGQLSYGSLNENGMQLLAKDVEYYWLNNENNSIRTYVNGRYFLYMGVGGVGRVVEVK